MLMRRALLFLHHLVKKGWKATGKWREEQEVRISRRNS